MDLMVSLVATGGGNFSDPNRLPRWTHQDAGLRLLDTANTIRNASETQFWSLGIDAMGASNTSAFGVDTYKTLLNIISGAGVAYAFIGPNPSGSQTTTWRITVDGVEYEIAQAVASGRRSFLGYTSSQGVFTADAHAGSGRHTGLDAGGQYFATPDSGAIYGPSEVFKFPLLEYERSLLVEVKHSAAISASISENSGVCYYDGFPT